jgi:predicted transcriptional regulator
VFKKYENNKKYDYSYYDNQFKKQVYIFLFLVENEIYWQLNYENKIQSLDKHISSQEFVKYCWENQMDIQSLIKSIFNYINNLLSKKTQVVKAEKEKYESEINCLNKAITNLEELINLDICEDIQQKIIKIK